MEPKVEDLPPRPQPPEPGDCCGGGCARCVLDIYAEALERWEQQVRDLGKGDAR